MGPGLFIKDGAWNLVLNSDSHHNYDPYTSNGAGQSADGFGAHIGPQPARAMCSAAAAPGRTTDDGFDLINALVPGDDRIVLGLAATATCRARTRHWRRATATASRPAAMADAMWRMA
jgi:hypothetical protein